MACTYHIHIVYHQPLHPFSSSQLEWIAMIPSPLPPYNSSKCSCWLWTHVSYTIIALQGYPTHFIVMLMYMYRPWPTSIMACSVWTNQSKVISNEDTCCGCVSFVLNDAPQSDGYRVEVQYTQYFYILDERIRTVRSQDCCKLFIVYLPFWCYCNIIH